MMNYSVKLGTMIHTKSITDLKIEWGIRSYIVIKSFPAEYSYSRPNQTEGQSAHNDQSIIITQVSRRLRQVTEHYALWGSKIDLFSIKDISRTRDEALTVSEEYMVTMHQCWLPDFDDLHVVIHGILSHLSVWKWCGQLTCTCCTKKKKKKNGIETMLGSYCKSKNVSKNTIPNNK